MTVTTYVQRRSVVHKDSGGNARGNPDVCLTPPDPTPVLYMNTAYDLHTSKGSKTVFVDGNSIMLKDAEFSTSFCDEPGTVGGVVSGVNKGIAKFSSYSFTVFTEGRNTARHLDSMLMNGDPPNLAGVYRAKSSTPGHWTIDCVLQILCKVEPDLVKKLNKLSELKTLDEVYWDDPYYDGTKWTTRRFPGGGYNSAKDKAIGLVTAGTCEQGAVTVKHELIHQEQPGGMPWADMEDAAYRETEQWAINHGLPSQAPPGYSFRQTGSGGAATVNFGEIQRMVRDLYPVPSATSGPPPPQCIGHNPANGNSIMRDPVTKTTFERAPQRGDSYGGPETRKGERDIDPKSLKCPPKGGTP